MQRSLMIIVLASLPRISSTRPSFPPRVPTSTVSPSTSGVRSAGFTVPRLRCCRQKKISVMRTAISASASMRS